MTAPLGGHALYEGRLWHRRIKPAHRFERRLTMAWLELGRLGELDDLSRLLSTSRPAPARVLRRDLPGDLELSTEAWVRQELAARLGVEPDGAVYALCNLRTWGWCFNPLTTLWAFDAAGEPVAELLSVSNTPWHERHSYVIDRRRGEGGDVEFMKEFHVSPLLPMELRYRLRSPLPGEELSLRLSLSDLEGALVFDSGFTARRRPLDSAGIRRLLLSSPTQAVSFGIYSQALRLKAKGARFHHHPGEIRVPTI
jgi:DUF1365 family protein